MIMFAFTTVYSLHIENIWNYALENPLAAKSFVVFAIVTISCIVYLVHSCVRLVKAKRNRNDEEKRKSFSLKNYFYATVNHNKFDINVNKAKLLEIKKQNEDLRLRLSQLKAKLAVSNSIQDDISSIIDMEDTRSLDVECKTNMYPNLKNLKRSLN